MDSNQEACKATTEGAKGWVVTVHWSFVAVFGTLNYALALWCLASCTTTKRPMKVLLISMFVPAILVCVVLGLLSASLLHDLLSCNSKETIKIVIIAAMMYLFLEMIELACIAFIAVARVVVVWSSQGSELGMGTAAALLVSAYAYPFVTLCLIMLGLAGTLMTGVQPETTEDPLLQSEITVDYFLEPETTEDPLLQSEITVDHLPEPETTEDPLLMVYFSLCMVLPILVAIVAYALMIVAVVRNKRRLAASESQSRPTPVMDSATWGMLAVFITKLVFALPYAITHLIHPSILVHLIFLLWFITQHVVDPLVFIFFNLHHRRRVLDLLTACKTRIACRRAHLYTSELSTRMQSLTGDPEL